MWHFLTVSRKKFWRKKTVEKSIRWSGIKTPTAFRDRFQSRPTFPKLWEATKLSIWEARVKIWALTVFPNRQKTNIQKEGETTRLKFDKNSQVDFYDCWYLCFDFQALIKSSLAKRKVWSVNYLWDLRRSWWKGIDCFLSKKENSFAPKRALKSPTRPVSRFTRSINAAGLFRLKHFLRRTVSYNASHIRVQ